MSGKLIIVYTDGHIDEEDYEGKEPALETLQKHVKGYIELLPAMIRYQGKHCQAFVNEDGLQLDLPFNQFASRLAEHAFRIVGNMVLVVPKP